MSASPVTYTGLMVPQMLHLLILVVAVLKTASYHTLSTFVMIQVLKMIQVVEILKRMAQLPFWLPRVQQVSRLRSHQGTCTIYTNANPDDTSLVEVQNRGISDLTKKTYGSKFVLSKIIIKI